MRTVYLKGEDLKTLEPIIEAEGWTPLPSSSLAIAMVDDTGIACFHILQLVAHPEPLWVRPDLRNTSIAWDLVGEMDRFVKETNTNRIMCIADSPAVAKMCEALGMKKVKSPVYVRG